jgi:DNA-binding CsgD family transcriptional regulator
MAGVDAERTPSTPHAFDPRCLDGLSDPARQLVEIGAVFGTSFKVTEVAEAMGQTVGGLLGAIREAVASGALIATSDSLEFRDLETHRMAYEATPSALLSALHRQIGELLLERREWAAAASHLMNGLRAGDQVAASGLEHVAREVRTSTPEWSSELALRALELTDAGDVDRFDRAATAVENLMAAARLQEAEYLASSALGSHGVPFAAAARLRLTLAQLCLFSGRPQAAADEIETVVSDPMVPAPLRAPAELCLLWARLALGDRPAAGGQVEAILSGGPGRDELLAPALAALAVMTWRDGRVADGLGLARAAVVRGDRQPPTVGGPFARLWLASMLTALGELAEARALVDAARDEIIVGRETLWSAAPVIAVARIDLAAGRLDDASASARVAIDLATKLGTSCFLSPARTVLAEVELMAGELSEAAAHLEGDGSAVAWPPWTASSRRLAEARLAEAIDGPDQVKSRADGPYDDLALDAGLLLDDPAGAAWLVRTALAADDRERAERVLAEAERLAVLNASFPTVVAASQHARGLVHADSESVREAGTLHRHVGAQASAWEDAGVLRLGGDDRSAGKEQLEQAVVAYERMGAERDAARVRARLRSIGVRWRHGRRAERPVSGWASLTDTECAVAELVAEGLTNAQVADRLYLSRHTVDFNLRQIFRKLGITSRVALARLHFERQGGGGPDGLRVRVMPD